MKMMKDFKEFAMRGNVMDLAVGVIIGAAFGKIVASLVNDIIMPPLGLLVGGVDFRNIVVTMKDAVTDPATGKTVAEAVTLKLGNFIQTLVDFTIIALVIFLLISGVNKLVRKKAVETPPPPPPAPTREEELLTEIRALLKGSRN